MATPLAPARPVQADTVYIGLGNFGISKLITCENLSTSMPRAAISVATSTHLAVFESLQRLLTCSLGFITVDGFRTYAGFRQVFCNSVCAAWSSGEYQDMIDLLLDHLLEQKSLCSFSAR